MNHNFLHTILFLSCCSWLQISSTIAFPWDPKVQTKYGEIEGEFKDGVAVFRNVPFAQPPIGDLRFKPPQPLENWKGTLDGKKTPKLCPQLKATDLFHLGEEDCLYMHIYVPEDAFKKNITELPVLFWIFGGGFVMGDGYEFGFYDGTNLAKNTNSIVVTTNYRVGPFGFLAHKYLQNEDPDHSTGNMGVRDQRAAMQIVQEIIGEFGGDKKRVAIFGESAGAMSVCYHIASEASKGLFSAAISESGSCDTTQFFRPLKNQSEFGSYYALKFGCNDTSMDQEEFLKCLRKADVKDIMNGFFSWFEKHWPNPETEKYFAKIFDGDSKKAKEFLGSKLFRAVPPGWDPPLSPVMPFGPTIDGTHVGTFDMPLHAMINGFGSSVPAIFGSNRNEGSIFVPFLPIVDKGVSLFPLTDASVEKSLFLFLNRNHTFVNLVLEHYPKGDYNNDNIARIAMILRDCTFACPARRAVRVLSERGVNAYLYHFVTPLTNWIEYGLLGDYHSSELAFVFGNQWPAIIHDFDKGEAEVSKAFQFYWSNLAKTGDVNQGDSETEFLHWPKYNKTSSLNMNLDYPLNTEIGLLSGKCDFWDTQKKWYKH